VFSIHDVTEPDLIFIRAERVSIIGEKYVEGPPDLTIAVDDILR